MNYRISTILVIVFSLSYSITIMTLLHALPKKDLQDFPETSAGKEVKNFLIVSQIMRTITSVLLLKVISGVPESNRANRNLIFPYIIWNIIATFVCAVVIVHSILMSVTSGAAIAFITLIGLGTSMVALSIVLMFLHYRHLLMPLRSRGPSTIAILSNATKERTKSFLTEKESL